MDTIIVPLTISSTEVELPIEISGDDIVPLSIESDSVIPIEYETFINLNPDVDRYQGSYLVTPKANLDQNLITQNKLMEENLVVTRVPFYQVSNLSGTTVYIADE